MSSKTHVWAVVALAAMGVAGIVALEAFASGDSEPLLLVLVGFLAPTVAALLNTAKQGEANAKLDRIDGRLNGELDARIAAAVQVALREYHAATAEDCTGDGCR